MPLALLDQGKVDVELPSVGLEVGWAAGEPALEAMAVAVALAASKPMHRKPV